MHISMQRWHDVADILQMLMFVMLNVLVHPHPKGF